MILLPRLTANSSIISEQSRNIFIFVSFQFSYITNIYLKGTQFPFLSIYKPFQLIKMPTTACSNCFSPRFQAKMLSYSNVVPCHVPNLAMYNKCLKKYLFRIKTSSLVNLGCLEMFHSTFLSLIIH